MPTYIESGKAHDERFERLFAPWNEVDIDPIPELVPCAMCGTYTEADNIEVRDGVKWCKDCIEYETNNEDK